MFRCLVLVLRLASVCLAQFQTATNLRDLARILPLEVRDVAASACVFLACFFVSCESLKSNGRIALVDKQADPRQLLCREV